MMTESLKVALGEFPKVMTGSLDHGLTWFQPTHFEQEQVTPV
jgi:hypothetical protein